MGNVFCRMSFVYGFDRPAGSRLISLIDYYNSRSFLGVFRGNVLFQDFQPCSQGCPPQIPATYIATQHYTCIFVCSVASHGKMHSEDLGQGGGRAIEGVRETQESQQDTGRERETRCGRCLLYVSAMLGAGNGSGSRRRLALLGAWMRSPRLPSPRLPSPNPCTRVLNSTSWQLIR